MGVYFNSHQVESIGEKLLGKNRHVSLPKGRCLVAVCDRGPFKLAAKVDDPNEFNELYQQYRTGYLLSFALYDCPAESLTRTG